MRKAVGTTLIASIFVTAAPAVAADWHYITTGSTNTETYVDAQSIRTSSDSTGIYRMAWIKRDHKRDKTTKDRQTMVLYKFRCETFEAAAISITTYGPDGQLTYSDNVQNVEFEPAIPETVGYSTLEFVCGQ